MTDCPSLTFASLNCNSLSLTQNRQLFDQKINVITSLGTDIIFLCDIRLHEGNVNGLLRFKQALLHTKYTRYHCYVNSTTFKRGVAILFKVGLDFNLLREHKDQDENVLGLNVTIGGQDFWSAQSMGLIKRAGIFITISVYF